MIIALVQGKTVKHVRFEKDEPIDIYINNHVYAENVEVEA